MKKAMKKRAPRAEPLFLLPEPAGMTPATGRSGLLPHLANLNTHTEPPCSR